MLVTWIDIRYGGTRREYDRHAVCRIGRAAQFSPIRQPHYFGEIVFRMSVQD